MLFFWYFHLLLFQSSVCLHSICLIFLLYFFFTFQSSCSKMPYSIKATESKSQNSRKKKKKKKREASKKQIMTNKGPLKIYDGSNVLEKCMNAAIVQWCPLCISALIRNRDRWDIWVFFPLKANNKNFLLLYFVICFACPKSCDLNSLTCLPFKTSLHSLHRNILTC